MGELYYITLLQQNQLIHFRPYDSMEVYIILDNFLPFLVSVISEEIQTRDLLIDVNAYLHKYYALALCTMCLINILTQHLTPGPDFSSLGYGALEEHGPFQPGKNGLLTKNKYSWDVGKITN
ncbi:hypothetical protein NC652_010020 [Populus alba x Populus x berolinensis]|nr:hypothetical protein NC652_010020 [Populus alba x Populus x berolinensis]